MNRQLFLVLVATLVITAGCGKETARKLGTEVAKGDFNDAASLRRAMAGVSGVFGVSTWDRGTDREVVQGKQLIDAAAASGNGHFFSALTGDEIADRYRWIEQDGYSVDVVALRARDPALVTVRQFLEQMVAAAENDSE